MTDSTGSIAAPSLKTLDGSKPHTFIIPAKKINEGPDVSDFLISKAYRDIMTFVLQLNASMFPRCSTHAGTKPTETQTWELGSPDVIFSNTVIRLRQLLSTLNSMIDEVPPDKGPRRFGNVSFRKWFQTVEGQISDLLTDHVPSKVLSFNTATELSAKSELEAYILGSFGSPQRLDYGTGHELSFLAFLGSIWKLGGFESRASGEEERAIVLGVIAPYLDLIRKLIKTYTLEPAGSHGVWGLDDHSFVPYIFGSAQFAPAISSVEHMPAEGSFADSPDPADVIKAAVVERERQRNMYFGAIGFIYDVKKGPFWEHSPMLYDISGVRTGWAKINKGMIKMYSAEVLSKFPVVQHFPFGSLFSWDQDPTAITPATSVHTSSQPAAERVGSAFMHQASSRRSPQVATNAPWAGQSTNLPPPTVRTGAPWAGKTALPPSLVSAATGQLPTRAPWAGSDTRSSAQRLPPTQAPWAPGTSNPIAGSMLPPNRAPCAKPSSDPSSAGD